MTGPLFIDFEASGLSKESYPIEVGCADAVGGASWLIKPLAHWADWDPAAEALHKITRAELVEHGMESAKVCMELESVVKDRIVYCDSAHDPMWLRRLFRHSIGRNERIIVANVWTLWGGDGCAEYAKFCEARPACHRALADATLMQSFHEKWAAHRPSEPIHAP